MRVRLSSLLVSLIPIVVCQGQESVQVEGLCTQESTAIPAASELLARKRLSSKYVAGSAQAQGSEWMWNVRMPRIMTAGEPMMAPSRGPVEVRKSDCAARWVPQR
jgi:hypothetical protein